MCVFSKTERLPKRGFFPLLFLFLAVSCSERIDLELVRHDPVLVVDGRITSDSVPQVIRLSRSSSYFDSDLRHWPVSGAEVAVIQDGRRYPFRESGTEAGSYYSMESFSGKPGSACRMEVWADVAEKGVRSFYTAEDTMPSFPGLDSVRSTYGYKPGSISSRRIGWSILLYGRDLPGDDFYGLGLYIDGKNYNDSLQTLKLMDDKSFSCWQINGLPAFFFQTFRNSAAVVSSGSELEIRLMNYSEGYFRYIDDVRTALRPDLPIFGGAPSNCRGNVSGGAFGYFAVYAVRRATVILSAKDSIDWENSRR